jgi:phosphatidylglycerophosphate synthase
LTRGMSSYYHARVKTERDPLPRNIVLSMAVFFAGQCALITALALVDGLPMRRIATFYPASLALHVLAAAFLVRAKEDFTVESDGRRLERVNLANLLTLVRISTLPTILYLIMSGRDRTIFVQAIVLAAAIFLTDLLDGFVSRTMRQCTRIGRLLDPISDYCLIGALSFVLLAYGLIDRWFFFIIAGRLFLQGLGMAIFFFMRRPVPPKPTFLGKAIIASTMSLYGLSILKPFVRGPFGAIFIGLEIAVAALAVLSTADKLLVFLRQARAGRQGGD